MSIIAFVAGVLGKRILDKSIDKLMDTASKNSFVIQALDEFSLLKPKLKPGFESIYAHALVQYVAEAEEAMRGYQKLFAEREAQASFKSGQYQNDFKKLEDDLWVNLRTNPDFDDWKRDFHMDKALLKEALQLFQDIYHDLTLRTASPFQIKKYYEDLAFQKGMLEDKEKRSFDYQIKKYLQRLRQDFIDHFLEPKDCYVPLIGYQFARQTGDLTYGAIQRSEVKAKLEQMEELGIGDSADLRDFHALERAGKEKRRKYFKPVEQYFQMVLNEGNPERYKFIVMLGEYGTGKSTFFKYLAYSLASGILGEEHPKTITDARQRIPILLPLRDFNGEPISRFIVSHLNEYGVKDFDKAELETKLRDGKLLLLFDGFDEMISREATTRKKYHAGILKELIPERRDSGSLVLLSSREEYFRGVAERKDIFGLDDNSDKVKVDFLHLDTFTEAQIREFLEKKKEPGQDADALMEQINTIFDLKDLAKRAVLLDLIIKYLPQLLARRKNPTAPIRSVELYREVFAKELARVEREVFHGKAFLGSAEKQRGLLRNLALHLYANNGLNFTYQEAEDSLHEAMGYKEGTQKRTIEKDLTAFLTFSFLLNDGEERYRFSHKSFRDYLVAEAFHEEIEMGEPKDFGKRLNTDEVTTFLSEFDPDKQRLKEWIDVSKDLRGDLEFRGSNAMKALLQVDKAYLKNKTVFRAKLREVDFTGADFQGTVFAESVMEDCVFDANLFDMDWKEGEFRGGECHFRGKIDWGFASRREHPQAWENRSPSKLEQFPSLAVLDLSGMPLSDLGPLSKLQNLTSLNLGGKKVSDLGPLSPLKNLTSLYLGGTKVSDLRPLSPLQNLNFLNLVRTEVTDLRPLSKLQNLTSLNLARTEVTDLRPLSKLQNLTSLDLEGTKVTGLRPLSPLQNLTSLNLGWTKVSDLGPLSKLQNLTSLNLGATQVSDLRPLSNLKNLISLYLAGTQVADLGPFSKLQNLTSLNLEGTQVSDLGPLSYLQNLTSLHLLGTQVSNLGPLSKLQNLTSLNLVDTQVSDLGPLSGLQNLKNLVLDSEMIPPKQLGQFKSDRPDVDIHFW